MTLPDANVIDSTRPADIVPAFDRLHKSFDLSPIATIFINDQLLCTKSNLAFCKLVEFSEPQIIGRRIDSFFELTEPEQFINALQALNDETAAQFEAKILKGDQKIWVSLDIRIVEAKNFVVFFEEITLAVQTDYQSRLASAMIKAARDAVVVTDEQNRIIMTNPAFTQISGYELNEMAGHEPTIFGSGRHSKEFYDNIWSELNKRGRWVGEIWNRKKTGELYPSLVSVSRIEADRYNLQTHLYVYVDLSEQRQINDEMFDLAFLDALTGMPNRRLIADRLQYKLDRAVRTGKGVAVMAVDLDHFKHVNDHFGHQSGDQLLIEAANRMRNLLRRGDTIGRLGGDDFLVIMPDIIDSDYPAMIAASLIEALSKPYQLNEIEILSGASVGIAISPADGESVNDLLRHADSAMYHAKHSGRGRLAFFTKDLTERAARRLALTAAIRRGIDRKEFKLAWQPQIDLKTHRLIGLEALIRWPQTDGSMISPGEFIPLAEESGLIIPLGDWIILEVCRQVREWRNSGYMVPRVGINISAIQIARSPVAAAIKQGLARYNLDPNCLEIEITESVLMQFTGESSIAFRTVIDVGADIAIDDFGTGYSSLSYLRHLNVSRIKIDKSFVDEVAVRSDDQAIIKAIRMMSEELGISTIAEGVETHAQFEMLQKIGVNFGQGFFWAKPLFEDQIRPWLACEGAPDAAG